LFSKISKTNVCFFWDKHLNPFSIFVGDILGMHNYLKKLSLLNFKNYEEISTGLCSKINCFTGNNGVGKTNILDAVYYLSMCKSFFGNSDSFNIRHGQDFFMIQGEFDCQDITENIYCGLKSGQRKVFRRNGKDYDRLADHIGLIPSVMVSPADSSLILDGSEERRKFMDMVISQYDHVYLDDLIRYNRSLVQRNLQLKDFSKRNWFDKEMLELWDVQLAITGNRIFEKRLAFVNEIIPVFQSYYNFVSEGEEQVGMEYQSQLVSENFEDLLRQSVEKDRIIQYTSVGVHKDDLVLSLNNHPIKRLGSQGQQKTYLVALKLAQFDFIAKHTGRVPILLLDDIFDKFDQNRVEKIIHLVASPNFGQIFISDTHTNRMSDILKQINSDFQLMAIDTSGNITQVEK
jgi:DNA replication and repair protein RecF